MCGIAGKVSFGNKPVTERDLKHMTDAIKHRGPDDEGFHISADQKVGLGHRRLSIIDLSPLGHQPMSYLDKYWITYNGEIYNFQDKKQELIKDGYQFKSNTDTEVILALYDKYGIDCLQHLRGMFAFAIYDQAKHILFCARDRLGQKPFKYYTDPKHFMFASELKAILTQPEYQREPDYLAIHHYLTLQYTPAPFTGFSGIKKLEPAHYLTVDLKSGRVDKQPYWQLDFSKKMDLSEEVWQTSIMDKLDEAVRLRMMSDVPLGAFLSGGLDSSAIVGLLARHSKQPVKTFSIGFKEQSYNEAPYARQIAQHFNTDHTEFIVEPSAIDMLPDLVAQYEEPYADSSALPTQIVSRLTHQHVTVALSGDGGDENFAGYGRYGIQKFALLYEKLRPLNKAMAIPATNFLAKTIPNTFFTRANHFASTLAHDYPHRYVNYVCYFNNDAKHALYGPAMRDKVWHEDSYKQIADKFKQANTSNKLDQTLYADIKTILADDFLTKWDIAAMATGLEVRSPFLDHEFMEHAAQIPSRLKLRGANDRKYILKQSLRGFLPDNIIDRRKMGFQAPIDIWFRTELNDYAQSLLRSPRAQSRGLFDQAAVNSIVNTHLHTKVNESTRMWALLTLELWFRKYFD